MPSQLSGTKPATLDDRAHLSALERSDSDAHEVRRNLRHDAATRR
jgi:hypothetical protein